MVKPEQRLRGEFEKKYRSHEGAPKFYCCHCNQHGKSLQHIALCGKKKAKQ